MIYIYNNSFQQILGSDVQNLQNETFALKMIHGLQNMLEILVSWDPVPNAEGVAYHTCESFPRAEFWPRGHPESMTESNHSEICI